MNKNNIMIVVISFMIVLVPFYSYAYDNTITHRDITKKAVLSPGLSNYLKQNLGIAGGLDEKINGQKIIDWLSDGSDYEDVPNCRASNHFHNPLLQWGQSYVTDAPWWMPVCTSAWGKYSNVTWATGYLSPAPDGTKATFSQEQEYAPYSWDKARKYFYEALTDTNSRTRDIDMGITFLTVGHIMHLLQDMAVPAHTRNDFSSHLLNGRKQPYEYYVKANPGLVSQSNPVFPSFSNNNLTKYWDTDKYNGSNPSTLTDIGLAEFSNGSYFSDYTIPNNGTTPEHAFPYPYLRSSNISGPSYQICPQEIAPGLMVNYVSRKNGQPCPLPTNADAIDHFAVVGILNPSGYRDANSSTYIWLDDNVHKTYAQELLPRAVGYSAGLLNYFFRGEVEISLPDSGIYAQAPNLAHDQGFTSFTVKARNTTANGDAMTNGDIRLVIRYREALWDPFLYSPVTKSNSYYYIVSPPSNTRAIPIDSAVELTFDLTQSPLPKWATDVTIQVVYYGELGAEANGVAVGYKDISEPTPVDIYNDMGMTCLYQNWYTAGSPEALALAGSNQWDVYPHDLEVYIRFSPAGTNDPSKRDASPQNYHVHITPTIPGDTATVNHTRKPAVISDYTYQTSFYFMAIPTHQSDPWQHVPWLYNRTTTAIKNQTEYSTEQGKYIDTQPNLCFYRDAKMWFDAGAIVISEAYPYNTVCSFEQVITCP